MTEREKEKDADWHRFTRLEIEKMNPAVWEKYLANLKKQGHIVQYEINRDVVWIKKGKKNE